MNNIKIKLDELVKKYETPDFIKSDPIQFLHNYKSKQDIEITGIIASSLAYGKREAFISKLNDIFNIMGNSPYKFLLNFKGNEFKGFKYRFIKENDLVDLLFCLKKLYTNNSLEKLFYEGYKKFATIKDVRVVRRKNMFRIPNTDITTGCIISFESVQDVTHRKHWLHHSISRDSSNISYHVLSVKKLPRRGVFLWFKHGNPYVFGI